MKRKENPPRTSKLKEKLVFSSENESPWESSPDITAEPPKIRTINSQEASGTQV
jgi:hypothetical protein